jgi:mono/diheme cytochrome c family protein
MTGLRSIAIIAAICWPFLATAEAGPAPSTQAYEGREIALDACSACHKVTHSQKTPPQVPNPEELTWVTAPTFAEIARKHGMDQVYLRKAITDPKHPMREQEWKSSDLDAAVAYFRYLRAHPAQ